MGSTSRPRLVAGLVAAGLLLGLAMALPRWGNLRQRAVVEAAQTFSLSSIADGGYQWSLRDGRPARGEGLVRERIQIFDRSDLMELELRAGLESGLGVEEGDELAVLHAPHLERQLAKIKAEREGVAAQRALLVVGARREEVAEAQRALDIALATLEGERPQLERARSLAQEGFLSQVELEAAELQGRLRELAVDLARARIAVARSSAQPEALAVLDAQTTAADAEISEIEDLLTANIVHSPITGVVEVGGNRVVLRVYDLSKVYLRLPVPEANRLLVDKGSPVHFVTASNPGQVFDGVVVDVSEDASTLNGTQVFWGSVEIPNPNNELRSGMSGVARIELRQGRGLVSWLLFELVGY